MCHISILPAFAKVLLSNPIGTHFSIAYNVYLDVDVSDTTMAVLGQINKHFFFTSNKKRSGNLSCVWFYIPHRLVKLILTMGYGITPSMGGLLNGQPLELSGLKH